VTDRCLSRVSPWLAVLGLAAPACSIIAGLGDYHLKGDGSGGSGGGTSSAGTSSTTGTSGSGGGPSAGSRLSAGFKHACFVRDAGSVHCWGSNQDGQIGADPQTRSFTDFPSYEVPGTSSKTFDSVSAGATHTCAIETGGHAWCWGSNAQQALGLDPAQGSGFRMAQPTMIDALQIAAGHDFTCAITPDTSVACWGSNDHGALGDKSQPTTFKPQSVGVNAATSLTTCADCSTACALAGGKVWCWGGDQPQPAEVTGVQAVGSIALGHSVGASSDVLFLLTEGHDLYVARRGAPGAAYGSPALVASGVAQVSAGDRVCIWPTTGAPRCSDTLGDPIQLSALTTAGLPAAETELRVGWGYACARAGSDPYCIGANEIGQLGDGKSEKVVTPSQVETGVTAMFHGPHCTTLALNTGYRAFGQCGVYPPAGPRLYPADLSSSIAPAGTDTIRTGPKSDLSVDDRGYFHDPVHGLRMFEAGVVKTAHLPSPGPGMDYDAVVVSRDFDVGLVGGTITLVEVTSGFSAGAHGLFGQPGSSPFTPTLSGVQGVAGSASAGHICAWTSSSVYCWGDNSSGQVSPATLDAGSTDVSAPTLVAGVPGPVVKVVVGSRHTCALTNNGAVYCWGANDRLQLGPTVGDAGPALIDFPAATPMLVHLAGGDDFVCAAGVALPDVYCWGNNGYGACGQPLLGNSAAKKVQGLGGTETIGALAAGAGSVCVLASGGSLGLLCWGQSTRGEVGNGQAIDRTDAWAPVSFPP
jgi:alpha-tubulin suppressor-like RCC1 family protein